MIITYEVGTGLYFNLTNRCTNGCGFCVRSLSDGFYGDLWLEHEPTVEEIIADLSARNFEKYSEAVFCGYGEPTLRLDDMISVCEKSLKKSNLKIRLNTNGHANLIHKKDVTYAFAGIFDEISVSLNAADAESYEKICKPAYGRGTFDEILKFAVSAKKYVPKVVFSVVKGTISDGEIEKCQILSDSLGIPLKVRERI